MTIPCLTCNGKGFIVCAGYAGIRYPQVCKGCNGSGTQVVRP